MTIYRGAGGSISSEVESTVIPVSQGGTGATTIAEARTNLETAKSGVNADITQLIGLEVPLSVAQGGTGATSATQARTNLGAASSSQGSKADTALQPADVATVATSGSYNDLTDKPTVPDTLNSLTDVTITSVATDQLLKYNGSAWVNFTPTSGTGDVVGPSSATDGAVALFDGTTGKLLKNGVVLGSAATTSSSAYATAAQGTKADSALQSSAIGVSIQAYDAQLADVAGLTATDNGVIIGNGTNFVVESGSTLRSSLGLAIGTDVLAPNGSAASLTSFPTFNQNTTGTAANVTGTVAIANGGTGQTTAATARAALLPSYATNGGKVLAVKSDASDIEYISVGGTGTVTSVDMSVPTGLSVSGNPVTSTGTLAITYSAGYAIPTTAKQTEWDTAYTDRNKWDGGATGLTAATGRASLDVTATGADTTYAYRANNLSDLASASTARTNLGLAAIAASGSASDLSTGTVGTARLASGTADSTTYLRGDQTWATVSGGSSVDIQTFNSGDADLTWDKPTGSQTMVKIQVWAGGGGGSRQVAANSTAAGGGGAYNEFICPISYMASTAAITVGAAGVGRTASTGNGTSGGNSSVVIANYPSGSKTIIAYGGGGGANAVGCSGPTGGGGGGLLSVGTTGGGGGKGYAAGAGTSGSIYTQGDPTAGGNGGTDTTSNAASGGVFGGGGGGRGVNTAGYGGANSYYGGGGGGSGATAVAGVSFYGGSGGTNAAGTVPSGGGGCSTAANTNGSNGGAGRVVITSW